MTTFAAAARITRPSSYLSSDGEKPIFSGDGQKQSEVAPETGAARTRRPVGTGMIYWTLPLNN